MCEVGAPEGAKRGGVNISFFLTKKKNCHRLSTLYHILSDYSLLIMTEKEGKKMKEKRRKEEENISEHILFLLLKCDPSQMHFFLHNDKSPDFISGCSFNCENTGSTYELDV